MRFNYPLDPMVQESHNGEESRWRARCVSSCSQPNARHPWNSAPPPAAVLVLRGSVAAAPFLWNHATSAKSISEYVAVSSALVRKSAGGSRPVGSIPTSLVHIAASCPGVGYSSDSG